NKLNLPRDRWKMRTTSSVEECEARKVTDADHLSDNVSQSEAAYFDDLVARKGKFNPFRRRGWRMLAKRFGQWKDQSGTLNLLDIGCGTGNSQKIYIEHCHRYTGLDLSEIAISVARQKYPD